MSARNILLAVLGLYLGGVIYNVAKGKPFALGLVWPLRAWLVITGQAT